jgi:hypothetical protein
VNVAELRTILAHLPDDLPVVLGGKGSQQAGVVERHDRGFAHVALGRERCGECDAPGDTIWEARPHDGYVVIRPPDGYGWRQDLYMGWPVPPPEIRGAVRDRKGLSAELDALNPLASEGEDG